MHNLMDIDNARIGQQPQLPHFVLDGVDAFARVLKTGNLNHMTAEDFLQFRNNYAVFTGCVHDVAQSKFRWLDGDDERDFETWCQIWESTTSRRPHDHPGFLRVMKPAGFTPAMVVFDHPSGARVIYSFYWKSLNDLPFFSGSDDPAIHMVSPYGYGGPLYEGSTINRVAVSEAFEARFGDELHRRGALSEFVREDLFEDRLVIRTQGQRIEQQSNVVVNLDRGPGQIWRDYLPKVRKNVNRARQNGLRVVFDPHGSYLDQFLGVYHDTMARTGATESFFLGKDKFELLGQTLGAVGGLSYVHVFDGEKMISTELLLLSPDTIYSFLGGTLSSCFEKRPNDLLKHEVIEWGAARGFKHYVLGGGISAGDGIFTYKRAFDPSGIHPFFVRRIQHSPERYDQLTWKRMRYEHAKKNNWKPREDFFPAYLA